MNVKCSITFLKESFGKLVPLNKYQKYNEASHFRFDLYQMVQVVNDNSGYYSLEWIELNLLSSSENYENTIDISTDLYFYYADYCWIYNTQSRIICISNDILNI